MNVKIKDLLGKRNVAANDSGQGTFENIITEMFPFSILNPLLTDFIKIIVYYAWQEL